MHAPPNTFQPLRAGSGMASLRGWLCALLLWALLQPVAAADLLDRIGLYARGGAPELALRLLDRRQPFVQDDPAAWERWERERIHIEQYRGDRQAVMARADALPAGAPAGFALWLRTQAVAAALELGHGAQARERLLRLIWSSGSAQSERYLPAWRRLVIRSYLQDGLLEDAQTAALRYQLDYGDQGEEWKMLHARVLLRAGRPAQAADLLSTWTTPEAHALSLLARLGSGGTSLEEARAEARDLLADEKAGLDLVYRLWGALAEASLKSGDLAGAVQALEQALGVRGAAPRDEPLVSLDADELWDAYTAYAEQLGNERQLLVGSDSQWLELAEKLGPREPLKSRAVYAYLGLHGDAGARAAAVDELARLLLAQPRGAAVLRELYLGSTRYPTVASLPVAVRQLLAREAIADADIALASRLLSGLERAPQEADPVDWQLRRARVLVLGGQWGEGVAVLGELLAGPRPLDAQSLDRLTQVVFDLQTLGEHEAACELLAAALERSDEPQRRRELLFWMADSRQIQGRHEEAARLYLDSAMLADPQARDAWAGTARYQAAEALAKAGLKGDAREIYESLLRATDDPARQAALRRAIQTLWLSPQAPPEAGG